MRNLYRPDKQPKKDKVRFKKNMTDAEKKEAYISLCEAARQYIHQITVKFLDNFENKDRFQMAAKTGIINTMPQQYNEAFINRVKRLEKMANSKGYDMKYSKWKTTEEYGFFFTRETK